MTFQSCRKLSLQFFNSLPFQSACRSRISNMNIISRFTSSKDCDLYFDLISDLYLSFGFYGFWRFTSSLLFLMVVLKCETFSFSFSGSCSTVWSQVALKFIDFFIGLKSENLRMHVLQATGFLWWLLLGSLLFGDIVFRVYSVLNSSLNGWWFKGWQVGKQSM